MEQVFVKCPSCGQDFDSQENFWWGADDEGHPTVENLRCPNCNASTEQNFDCGACPSQFKCELEESCPPTQKWDFDDFKEVECAPNCKEPVQQSTTNEGQNGQS